MNWIRKRVIVLALLVTMCMVMPVKAQGTDYLNKEKQTGSTAVTARVEMPEEEAEHPDDETVVTGDNAQIMMYVLMALGSMYVIKKRIE